MSFTTVNVSEQNDSQLPENNGSKGTISIVKNDVNRDPSADYIGNRNGAKSQSNRNRNLSCNQFLVDWFDSCQIPDVTYYIVMIASILICLLCGCSISLKLIRGTGDAWDHYWKQNNDQRIMGLDEFIFLIAVLTICLVFLSLWFAIVYDYFRRCEPKESLSVVFNRDLTPNNQPVATCGGEIEVKFSDRKVDDVHTMKISVEDNSQCINDLEKQVGKNELNGC